MNFKEFVKYSEESPTGLLRTKNSVAGKGRACAKVGDVAGSFKCNKDGTPKCVDISIQGNRYKNHIIIWILFGNSIPDGWVIDHLDGNPFNNKISNLMCKPKRHNHHNQKMCKRNTTGVNGVSLVEEGKYYRATWYSIEGVSKAKKFSVAKHGKTEAFDLACNYRYQIIQKLNQEGACYTDRHGTQKENKC